MSTALLSPPAGRGPQLVTADVTIDRIRIGGRKLDSNVATALVSAEVEYSLEKATTLTLGLRDSDSVFANARRWTLGLRAAVRRSDRAGYDRFALTHTSKSGNDFTLVFEDEVVWRLRSRKGFKKASRTNTTRAEFAYSLVRELTHPTVPFYSPEIYDRQPIAFSDKVQSLENERNRPLSDRQNQPYGFRANEKVTVKGVVANAHQRNVISRGLQVGAALKAPKVVLVAAISAAIVESNATNLPGGDRDSQGVLQQRPSQGWTGLRNIEKAFRQFYLGKRENGAGGAIAFYASTRTSSVGKIAQHVQGSAHPERYGERDEEARKNVGLWLGADRYGYRGSITREATEKRAVYEFMRGNPKDPNKGEDSWACLNRLAEEVNWRCFTFRGTIYFVNDRDLAAKTSWVVLRKTSPGIFALDYEWDANQTVKEIRLQVSAKRWSAPPGSVIRFIGVGFYIDQQPWLVAEYRQSFFSALADITLRAPEDPDPEPPEQVVSDTINIDTGAMAGGETTRDRIVNIATRELSRAGRDYIYAQVRPYPTTFRQSKIRTDCSGFTAMVYREAGAPDPSGLSYNGQGSTVTQAAAGKPVARPQPGDLIFYGSLTSGGSSGHVAIAISAREAISFGSQGGPRRHSITYRPVAGYRTYNFGN